jgi:hypothetical protein
LQRLACIYFPTHISTPTLDITAILLTPLFPTISHPEIAACDDPTHSISTSAARAT